MERRRALRVMCWVLAAACAVTAQMDAAELEGAGVARRDVPPHWFEGGTAPVGQCVSRAQSSTSRGPTADHNRRSLWMPTQ
jgi:hypothetical protein